MASEDKQPLFNVLQGADGGGLGLHRVLEGDAAAAKNAAAALVAKDPSGNLIYLKTDAGGSLVISEDADFACLSDYAKIDGNAALTLVSEIVLQNSKEYDRIGHIVSCFRDAEFLIEHVDDEGEVGETITELASILAGAGDYTDSEVSDCIKFTSGAAGIQKLRIRAKNMNALSDLRATISCREKQ